MTRSRLRLIRAIVIVAVVGAGVGYFALRRSASDAPITFKVGRIDRGTVEQTVTATGQLNAVVTVQVGSQVSGTIESLGADFNSVVKEGQIVAQIEPTRFKANYAQALASVKNAEAATARAKVNYDAAKVEWERGRALVEKKVIGDQEIDALKAKYDLGRVELQASEAQVAQARANLGIAKVDLEHTTIRSPISGTVLQRAVDVGQTVAASLSAPTLFTIAQDLSKMEVRASIDEADVGKLKEGLEANFTVDAHPGREFVATIHQIRSNPNVQQNVVTYDAILRVDNADGKLRPGMTASVRIVTEKRENVLRVPPGRPEGIVL
jgi:HlyD family secretion protein